VRFQDQLLQGSGQLNLVCHEIQRLMDRLSLGASSQDLFSRFNLATSIRYFFRLYFSFMLLPAPECADSTRG